MKKHALLSITLIIILITPSASAQMQKGLGFGARAGVNIADYTDSWGGVRAGLLAGVYTDYYIAPKWGLELGAYYSQQGSVGNLESGTLSGRVDHLLDYAQLQLGVKYHFIRGFRVFAAAQGGYLVNSQKKSVDNNGQKHSERLSGVNDWDANVVVGVGYTFRFGLDLQASYSRGFIPVFHGGHNYSSVYRVSVGWRFIGTGGRAVPKKQKSNK